MVALAGNELPLQLAEPAPYLATDAREGSVTPALSFAVCALAVAGLAMRRPVVRAERHSTAGPSMVSWPDAPPELMWAEAAWNDMQLHANDLGDSCIWIPTEYHAFDDSREWYFCTTQAANEGSVACFPLPMKTEGRNVYICSQPKGSRPAYYE
jgi:hypothetical protein